VHLLVLIAFVNQFTGHGLNITKPTPFLSTH